MMELIKNWAINIVIVTVFVTFLEIIMPNNSLKRYIKLIVGLLIIIVIVSPFINILINDMNIDKEVFSNIAIYDNFQAKDENVYIKEQSNQVIDIYKDNLKRDLERLMNDKTQYSIKESKFSIVEDSTLDNFGEIERIYILLCDKEDSDKYISSQITIDEIEQINVTIEEDKSNKIENYNDFEDIEAKILDFFKLPKDNIEIYIEHEKMRRK